MRTGNARLRPVPGLVLVALLLLGSGSAGSAQVRGADESVGLPQGGNGVALGPLFSVEDPGPGYVAGFPTAYGVDTVVSGRTVTKVFVGYSRNPDQATADSVSGVRVSTDGGRTYPQFQDNTIHPAAMARLRDGRLLAIDFIPAWTDAAHTAVSVTTRVSTDLGQTWSSVQGTFTPPAGAAFDTRFDRGLRLNRGATVLADGTLIVPAYTQYAGDAHGRVVLLQTGDGGQTWSQRSTMVAPTATQGANETGMTRTADGGLLAVMRTSGGSANLLQTRSYDDGITWSPPAAVAGPAGADTTSVDPDLLLQPNGVLLLSYGRPDNKLLVSYDGNGTTWTDYVVTYANPPATTGIGRTHGSSGYTALVSTAANQTLLVGDSCAPSWGCKEYQEKYQIWSRYVDAVTPGAGKLDLATKARLGLVSVAGAFAPANPAFPEQRPEGAFDGSSAEFAAARLASPAGMTITLDRTYTLNRIGLMLARGKAEDADVQLSVDGTTWTTVLSPRARTDYALRYATITAQSARYVRIQAPPGGTLTAVTELELYAADTDTFENDPVFQAPRGFTACDLATVTTVEEGGYQSARALRLLDLTPDAMATATEVVPDNATKHAGFAWSPGAFGGAFLFDVRGRNSAGTLVTPWHFALGPVSGTTNAVLSAYDGSDWHDLGTVAGVGTLGAWTNVAVDATLTGATVTVAGQRFTTSIRWQAPTVLSGVTFSSAGTAPYGMEFFLDDLAVS